MTRSAGSLPPRLPSAPGLEDVADSLSRVAPLVTRWTERLLAAHDPPLTPAQYGALQATAGGDAHGASLARRAGVSAAAVSQLLSGLQGAGLIERGARGDDRRRQSLSLTSAGQAALESARGLLAERLAEPLGDLPVAEVEALGRSLPRLEAILGGVAPPPRPGRRPRPPPPPSPPPPGRPEA